MVRSREKRQRKRVGRQQRSNKDQGPEKRACLMCLRQSKKVNTVEAQEVKRRRMS